MIATKQPTPLDLWRGRFGGHHRRLDQPRPAAALGYLAHGSLADGLIEVGKLTIVILYADEVRPGQEVLRLAGFSGTAMPWGVRWGGSDQCRFSKDLLLQPVPGGPGLRIDVAHADVLRIGLALHRELHRHARYPRLPMRQRIQLPKLRAAFYPADAATITGDGPELASFARQQRQSAGELLAAARRQHGDMQLYPLPWVSHHWRQAVAIYADLGRFPRRQVFALRRLPDDLAGFQGAAEFDFRSGSCPAVRNSSHRRSFARL